MTANTATGSYQVTADTSGNSGAGVTYELTNLTLLYQIYIPFSIGA
jgi:hypothetical protein